MEERAEHGVIAQNVHIPFAALNGVIPFKEIRDGVKAAFGHMARSIFRQRYISVTTEVTRDRFFGATRNDGAVFVQPQISLVKPFE